MDDERVVWVRAQPNRKLVQIIEPMPAGFSVTTQWWEKETLQRQDCEIAITGLSADGKAKRIG